MKRKLTPFAQSRLLPPPRPTKQIDPFAAGDFEGPVDVFGGGIGSDVVKQGDFESALRASDSTARRLVAGLFDALVGDDQGPPPAQFAGHFSQPIDGAPPEDHPRFGVVVKGSQEVQTRSPSGKEREARAAGLSGDLAENPPARCANAYLPPSLAEKSVDRLAMYSTLLATTGEV